MKTAEKIIKKVSSIVSFISYAGFLFIMLITVCDISMREFTGNSILGCYEIVEVMLMSAVFASFAYTQTEKGHVSVTILVLKFPKKIQMILYAMTNALSAFIAIALAYAAVLQGKTAIMSGYTTNVLLIPMAPFYYIEAITMVMFFITLVFESIKGFIAIFNKDIADEIALNF